MMDKKILDVTCGSRTIWFDKNHPVAIYADKRREETYGVWKSGERQSERSCIIDPDIQCDFTDLPFEDNSFNLVVWDPPHLKNVGDNAWLAKKYGKLGENWEQMLHDGYRECIRVLKPDGVLIFKWAETDIPAADVWKAIGEKPLFGHHSGKRSMTFWGCYMKLEEKSCVGKSLISRAKLMGELTKADAQKRYREMTGEEVYTAVLTLVNDMPDE